VSTITAPVFNGTDLRTRGTHWGLTRDEWLILALIEDDDLEPALAYWHHHAPHQYRDLLDGDGRWDFDETRQQYVSDTGTRLRKDDQQNLALLFVLALELDLEALAKQATTGTMTIDQWQEAAATMLKSGYTALGALGAGGIGRLTAADRGLITGTPAEEPRQPGLFRPEPGTGLADAMDRLRGFGEQLEQGDERAGTERQVVTRTGQYAGGGHTVYQEVRRASHGRARNSDGQPLYLMERNRLDDKAAHCRTDTFTVGCPELTDLGWVPIGTLPPPGTRTCRGHCRCDLEFTNDESEA
jgi:hypothetical protein